jgi:hypothetical protein
MNLTFSKTLSRDDKNEKHYELFDHQSPVAEFSCTRREGLFTFDSKRIKLNIRRRFILMPVITLLDEATGESMGQIKLAYARPPSRMYPDKLILGADTWRFTKHQVNFLFKRSTWGLYEFTLSTDRERIRYTFRVDYPAGISLGYSTAKSPFEGSIGYSGRNLLAVLAGFYLIENAFDDESA